MNAAYISILDTLHTNRKGTTAFPLEQFITQQSSPRVRTEQTGGRGDFSLVQASRANSPAWKRTVVEAPSPEHIRAFLYRYPLQMVFPPGLWDAVQSCRPCHRLGKPRHAKATCKPEKKQRCEFRSPKH